LTVLTDFFSLFPGLDFTQPLSVCL